MNSTAGSSAIVTAAFHAGQDCTSQHLITDLPTPLL